MQGRPAGNGVKMVRKCGDDAGVQQQKTAYYSCKYLNKFIYINGLILSYSKLHLAVFS